MRRGPEAFTLIEALLATALMLVVMVQIAQVQHAAKLSLERVRKPMAWTIDLVRGYSQFAADCAHFQNPMFLDKGQPVIDLTSVGGDPGGAGGSQLTFYAAEYLPAGSQDIRRITYKLSGGGLTRISDPPPGPGLHLPSRQAVIVPQVSGLEFALFDGKTFTAQWGNRQGLPQGLRVSFVTRDKRKVVWPHLFNGVMQLLPSE